jgi:hypothetical protein
MNILNIRTKLFNILWWTIIGIYSYAYAFYLPYTTFGSSQFNTLFWGVNFLAGFHILLRTGGFLK